MRFPIRRLYSVAASAGWSSPAVVPREMAPQFHFLTVENPAFLPDSNISQLLSEVLRCHTYSDRNVFNNVEKILKRSTNPDGVRLSKTKFIAVVFHAFGDEDVRKKLLKLADETEKCRIPGLKREQELFYKSMLPSNKLPTFEKCMYKDDLILCYFRRELKSANWLNIKSLLSAHPSSINLYNHISSLLDIVNQQKIPAQEALDVFMAFARHQNPYFINSDDFQKMFQKTSLFTVSKCTPNEFKHPKTSISQKECDLLKKNIDERVKSTKEGFVRTKEYEAMIRQVKKWKGSEKITDGNGVVVVDSLNYGKGVDPKEWKTISKQFEKVKFATRNPPKRIRDDVLKRYNGNAMFCDKLSTDDVLILRMALEFGPRTCLVTNDRYTDHRSLVCQTNENLQRIWDEFLVDAVHRHNFHNIERRRDYNLRIRRLDSDSDGDSTWILPVVTIKNDQYQIRSMQFYKIQKRK